MKATHLTIIFTILTIFAGMVLLSGCPVNEDKDEVELPTMDCELMADYVYNSCEYSFTTGGEDLEQTYTEEEAVEKCQEFENSPSDYEGSTWECIVDCADVYRYKDECEQYKACQSLCWGGGSDDDDDA